MIVFKTFLKVLNKNKIIIIIQTIMLLLFAGVNLETNENSISFVASKPDILIINSDENKGITKDLIKYIENNSNIIEIENNEEKINDVLFYREVNYVIYIPQNYSNDFMDGKNPEIEIKSTGDYQSSLAEMMISRYIKVANIYRYTTSNETELLSKINETLAKQTEVQVTSKLDTTSLEKAAFYFNFESYSLLNCLIYVISLLLSIFNGKKIKQRTIISSTDYRKNNRVLLLSNCLFSLIMWLFYLILGCILIGGVMFTRHGIIFILNSLVFTICATTIAFFIGNLVIKKDAINGITNVVALGSSFLCGAFVPQSWLPDFVLKFAHLLPTYYYINTNDSLIALETFNFDTLKPILINMGIMIIFSVIFVVLTNIIVKRKRKIG